MKKIVSFLFIIGFIITSSLRSQNKQILYGFDDIPQTLLLNPGVNTNYKYHIGLPVLSGISFHAGITGFTVANLFRENNIDFTTKILSTVDNLKENDYLQIHIQIEILNGGYQLNEKNYLSVGFYTELDVFMSMPKDILMLLKDGNRNHLNKVFSLSQGSFKSEALGVLHAGISRKMSLKFTAGARIKIYSGIFNVRSINNTGSFTTILNESNEYINYLENTNASIQSSGFYDENDKNVNPEDLINNAIFSKNIGLGIDIGFTYQFNKQTEISASLLDIGFVNYTKNTSNAKIAGNYVFSGIDFQYATNNNDYWQHLYDDFKSKVLLTNNRESYTVIRPIKFNSAYKYSWGAIRNKVNCSDMSSHFYNNSVGVQLFSVLRPTGPKTALTGFYQRKLSKIFNTKITYTVDDFSYSNIGIGLSTKIGKVNIYGMLDNLLKINDIADANNMSFQLGINLIDH